MAGTKSGSLWESPEFLRHLLLAFHDLAADAGALTAEKKDQIAASLHEHGFDMTWNAVRHIHLASSRLYTSSIIFKLPINNMASNESTQKPGRGWSEKAHEDLLVSVLENFKPSTVELKALTTRMETLGYTYSFDAVKQHVAKLRKAHETSKNGSTPNTPKKTPAKRAAPGSGRGKKNTAPAVKPPQTEEMDDDQNEFEKELKLFKAEDVDDGMGMNGEEFENPYKRPKTEASFEETSLGEA
ncbi:hypothetical protein LIA77_03128 [Sarocladium implicatum]|nr:hypothetical protein LIA77_03128 [Sarocladium implicatum]